MAETKEPNKGKEGLIKKYLDNTFGEEGLRTEVKITLTNETLVKVIVTAIVATGLGAFTFFSIKKIFNPLAVMRS